MSHFCPSFLAVHIFEEQKIPLEPAASPLCRTRLPWLQTIWPPCLPPQLGPKLSFQTPKQDGFPRGLGMSDPCYRVPGAKDGVR